MRDNTISFFGYQIFTGLKELHANNLAREVETLNQHPNVIAPKYERFHEDMKLADLDQHGS